jgi:signal peptidase I
MGNTLRDLVGVLVLVIALFLLMHLVVGNYYVEDESMQPELRSGDRIMINLMAYSISDPARGDVIFFKTPDGSSDQAKRVIGLPGDIIEIKNNAIFVNDVQLIEPYVRKATSYNLEEFPVPPQSYFVMGDNRNSIDDYLLTVPRENVLGRAWITAWPPDRWGGIDNYAQAAKAEVEEFP